MTDIVTDRQNVENETVFRFANQKCILTYKTQLDKEKLLEFLKKTSKISNPKFMRCAHENGDEECPYEHTHVLIDFGKAFQSRNARIFDYEGIHPHIKKILTKEHWTNSEKYLAKEDPANADLKSKDTIATVLKNCENVEDAVSLCKKLSEIPGALAGFNALHKTCAYKHVDKPFYPWQEKIIELVNEPPDDRHITWVCDKVGGGGKTWLTKYLVSEGLAQACAAPGGAYHFATLVQGWFKSGWNGRACIFNLTRSQEDHSIYGPLESVKDGLITAQKYQGETMVFNCPHVIVFANWWPEFSKLSLDRWICYELVEGVLNIKSTPQIINEIEEKKLLSPFSLFNRT